MSRRWDRAARLIRRDEPMARHTTFRIGGPAQYLAEATTEADLLALLKWASGSGLPARVIGTGANLLVADEGVSGLVVVNRVSGCRLRAGTGRVVAACGTCLSDVAAYCSGGGWTGLEWAIGIPGTLGGAIVGNAGAFGGYLSDSLVAVTVADAGGAKRTLPASECGFGYRTSRFKAQAPGGAVLLSAELSIHRGDADAIAAAVSSYSDKRLTSQPWEPSAGSVFKRTSLHPAGRLIEEAGLKGRREGQAQISERHANFIVNLGGATAADVLRLIAMARGAVKQRFGIDLELEIEMVS